MAIDLFSIGKITIHGYGLMIGLGFLAAVLTACYRAKKYNLSADHVSSLAIFVLLFGFAGGKLLYIIVDFKNFIKAPLQMLGSEGFVVYGGIITGILTIVLYCKLKKLSVLSYMDILVPSIAVNQALGRVGCFMAGCCYGRETDSCIGVIFPKGALAPAGVKLLPTQLISAVGMLLIAIGLMLYATRQQVRGTVAGYYLGAYAIGRFVIEFFRADYRGSVGFLSTSQFISIFNLIFAAGLLYFAYKLKLPTEANMLKAEKEETEESQTDEDAETEEPKIEAEPEAKEEPQTDETTEA